MEERKIMDLLKKDLHTITDIEKKTGISRSRVRTILAKLEGAGKIDVRQVGMAKLHSFLF